MKVTITIEADLPDHKSCVSAALDVEDYFETKWGNEASVMFECEASE